MRAKTTLAQTRRYRAKAQNNKLLQVALGIDNRRDFL